MRVPVGLVECLLGWWVGLNVKNACCVGLLGWYVGLNVLFCGNY